MPERIPARRLGQASEAASSVAFLASDEASYVSGTAYIVYGNTPWPERRHSGARAKRVNPESRDSPMCNCTSEFALTNARPGMTKMNQQ